MWNNFAIFNLIDIIITHSNIIITKYNIKTPFGTLLRGFFTKFRKFQRASGLTISKFPVEKSFLVRELSNAYNLIISLKAKQPNTADLLYNENIDFENIRKIAPGYTTDGVNFEISFILNAYIENVFTYIQI